MFTDWVNDGVFGDGFFLFGKGRSAYEERLEEYTTSVAIADAFSEGIEYEELDDSILDEIIGANNYNSTSIYTVVDEETLSEEEVEVSYGDLLAASDILRSYDFTEPEPGEYGIWVPGLPVMIESGLEKIGCKEWLMGLILDGIVAGVGAVLGFVPQMFVLFLFLAILEDCGYMARIAFVMDYNFPNQ